MKFNWKILVALVVVVGISFWGVDSIRARSYSGKDVDFSIGSGAVTVTNPTDSTIPVQLTGTGSRSFSLFESTMDVTGSSTRDGSGSRSTQLFEFELPVGVSTFSVARGKDVRFIASADQSIDATVQPLSQQDTQTTGIIVVIIIAGALFFISRSTDHALIKRLRNGNVQPTTKPAVAVASGGQGENLRSFGDNRTK
jgi:preprotein translocase subunit SecE